LAVHHCLRLVAAVLGLLLADRVLAVQARQRRQQTRLAAVVVVPRLVQVRQAVAVLFM
jgi:hypothetical protein